MATISANKLKLYKKEFATGRKVLYVAPTQDQARNIIWEALKNRLHGVGIPNEQKLQMKVPNEDGEQSTIFVGGWENRENYRGLTDVIHITFDEVDTLKHFFLGWLEIFRPMFLDTGGTANFIGTPKKESPNLRRLEKEFAGKDDFATFKFTSLDNPYLSRIELELLKKEYEGDMQSYKQEILAEYIENEGALFGYTNLLDLFTNTVTRTNEKFLTVDIADDGSDKTVFTFWNGLEATKIDLYEHLNTDGIINQIRESAGLERVPYSQIAVDAIGVGAGVASSPLLSGIIGFKSSYSALRTDADPTRLPNVHYLKNAPLITDYKNLRSQCVFTLASLVNDHKIAVRIEDQRIKSHIIEELSSYQDASTGDGKRMATMKEDVKAIIGRSPDCFIAGTMVKTPDGEKNIEELRIGDDVVTPFRTAKIAHIIKKKTDELYTLDGILTGTGKHKIFTGGGFARLDTLPMRVYYYTYSNYNRVVWKLLSLLSTKIRSIGFRELVNTFITAHIRMASGKADSPFIDRFGKMQMLGQYLRGMTSTIKTAIHSIMPLRILSLSSGQFMPVITLGNVGGMENNRSKIISRKRLSYQKCGTPQMWGKNGIARMRVYRGGNERKRWQHVSLVESSLRSILRNVENLISALILVPRNSIIRLANFTRIGIALCAERLLVSGSLNLARRVQRVVQRKCDGVDVYSLTLEQDNVYFANGILVENCSDTLLMRMYFVLRGKLSPVQDPIQSVVQERIQSQFYRNEQASRNESNK